MQGYQILKENPHASPANIKVCGIGSGGVNAVNNMIAAGIQGVELIAINTDTQHLNQSKSAISLALDGVTNGRGAGGDPAKGRAAAEAARDKIKEFISDTDLLVLSTGLGGGTGTGATPVVAEIAKELGILTLVVATTPFEWEGRRKAEIANNGLDELVDLVDSYMIIPNNNLMISPKKGALIADCFKYVDDVLCQALTGIVELLTRPGIVNQDFEDIRAVLENGGPCIIGVGEASGPGRAEEATRAAMNHPLLVNTPVVGAQKALVNIVASMKSLTLNEPDVAAQIVLDGLNYDQYLKVGTAFDDSLEDDKMRVTVIATGMGVVDDVDDADILHEEDLIPGFYGQMSYNNSNPGHNSPVQQQIPSFSSYGNGQVSGNVPRPEAFSRRNTPKDPHMVNSGKQYPGQIKPDDGVPVGVSELEVVPAYARTKRPLGRG